MLERCDMCDQSFRVVTKFPCKPVLRQCHNCHARSHYGCGDSWVCRGGQSLAAPAPPVPSIPYVHPPPRPQPPPPFPSPPPPSPGVDLGDILKRRMELADAVTRSARRKYEHAAKVQLRLSRSLMIADLEGRPSDRLCMVHVEAGMKRVRLRAEWHQAHRDAIQAARRYSGWCQGVMV